MQDDLENLINLIKTSDILFLNIHNPLWENARGYSFDQQLKTLYFPVSKKYLINKDLDKYEVRIGHSPSNYMILIGKLSSAREKDDIEKVYNLLMQNDRWDEEKIKLLLFDNRNGAPRKISYKLKIAKVLIYSQKSHKEINLLLI